MLNFLEPAINLTGQLLATPGISQEVKDSANNLLLQFLIQLQQEYENIKVSNSNIVKPTFV